MPSRGVRQGDPILSYLFISCAEGLTRLINSKVFIGLWQGCKIACGAPSIDHLFFADDSLLVF